MTANQIKIILQPFDIKMIIFLSTFIQRLLRDHFECSGVNFTKDKLLWVIDFGVKLPRQRSFLAVYIDWYPRDHVLQYSIFYKSLFCLIFIVFLLFSLSLLALWINSITILGFSLFFILAITRFILISINALLYDLSKWIFHSDFFLFFFGGILHVL